MQSRATEQHRFGLSAVVGTVLCWGAGNVMVRGIDLPALQLAFWRLLLSSIIYGALVVARRRRMTWAQLRVCVPVALVTGLWLVTFYEALKSTTVTNVAMIASLMPVVLMWSAARRFGEPVSLRLAGLVATAVAGTGLVLFGSSSVPTWSARGDLLAVLSMLLFCGNFVLAKEARQKVGALEFQATLWFVAMIVVSPAAALYGGGLPFPSITTWIWIVALIAVPGSGHLLMNWAHRHVRLMVSSTAMLGVPPISMVGAALFVDEPIKLAQVAGGLIVIVAVAAVIRRDMQLAVRHAPDPE